MDIATIGAKVLKRRGLLPEIDESEEINACSIHVAAQVNGKPQDWLLMFKNETHNHPTEIEPFGGAATCIGGASGIPVRPGLRPPGHAAHRLRRPRTPVAETLSGKLPQRKLAQTAAAGYSSYGNQIGLATGLVSEVYHPRLHRQAFGVRRGGGRRPGGECGPRTAPARDVVILLGGAPAGTASAAPPAPPRATTGSLSPPWPARSRRATPGGAEDPAAVPGWECHPAHQAVQRLRRRRRIRGRG